MALAGFNLAGAEVEGYVGMSTTGTFTRREPAPAGEPLALPPLSILRVKLPA